MCVGEDSGLHQLPGVYSLPAGPCGPALLAGVWTVTSSHGRECFHTIVHFYLVRFAETRYHSVFFHVYTILTYSKFMYDLEIISFTSENSGSPAEWLRER